MKSTQKDNVVVEINSLYYLESPVKENAVVGSAKIQLQGKTIATLDIMTKEEIEKKDIWDYFREFLSLAP